MALVLCRGCQRHVKPGDSACPFCGTPMAAPGGPRRAFGTAMVLGVGLAVESCNATPLYASGPYEPAAIGGFPAYDASNPRDGSSTDTALADVNDGAIMADASSDAAVDTDATPDAGGGGGDGGVAPGCDLLVAQQTMAALGLTAVGTPQTLDQTLPAALTDANWGLKAIVCQEAGYDLSSVAGSTVCLVGQDMTQVCQGYPARVWVVMKDGVVVCVYKSASAVTPGVYAADDPSCQG